MGITRPLFLIFSSFQQLTVNMLMIKFCPTLDLNRGSLASEATALTTEALPIHFSFFEMLSRLKFFVLARVILRRGRSSREADSRMQKLNRPASITFWVSLVPSLALEQQNIKYRTSILNLFLSTPACMSYLLPIVFALARDKTFGFVESVL